MPIYRIQLPEHYDYEAKSKEVAITAFHNDLVDLLSHGSDLDTHVSLISEEDADDHLWKA